MNSTTLLLATTTLALVACSKGEAGTEGPVGAQGPAGLAGPAGMDELGAAAIEPAPLPAGAKGEFEATDPVADDHPNLHAEPLLVAAVSETPASGPADEPAPPRTLAERKLAELAAKLGFGSKKS